MIDFHCHLDLYPNPQGIVQDCIAKNLYVLSVTTTPSAWIGTSALVKGAARIQTALGLHPQLAHERKSELDLFERLLPNTRYVGEIGLDGTPAYRPHWADQIAVFTRILDACGRAGGRILSIHSRRAATAVLDALEARPDSGIPFLHWFSGSVQELTRAIAIGCWLSIGPAMLGSQKGRALVLRMPRDRILLESDGPFVQVDGRAALPSDTPRVAEELSQLWQEPVEDVAALIKDNLHRLVTEATPGREMTQ
jgi:TatD DNase family protein